MAEHRPRIFISSTIYDFRDLRSAIKYWLEQFGYEVTCSEQNDFPVQADLNSYENCLLAIDDADYFILLIGNRVGGWYDQKERISITQMEYRHAYKRLKEGRLKLLIFVRSELWNIRDDRKQLERFLKEDEGRNFELTEEKIHQLTKSPSKFTNDAQFIFNFLDEVARKSEMLSATVGAGSLPPGNWIRQFRTFNDIADSVRVDLRLSASLRRAAMIANLCQEIISNFQSLTQKIVPEDGGKPCKYPANISPPEWPVSVIMKASE